MISRRSRPRRRPVRWLVLLLAGALAAWWGRGMVSRTRPPEYPANAFYEVKRGDLHISVTEEGSLRALNETVVRNGLEGLNRILRLVPEGTHVRKGELLVELDSSGLRERLNELELSYQDRLFQLMQAEGNLRIQKSLAESEIKDGELKLEIAEADLEKYRDGDAPFLVRTVEARSRVLAEQVRISRERLARTEDLFKSGNATRSELEADALSLKREQLGHSQYDEDLRLIRKFDQPNQLRLLESKVQQARQDLERAKQRTANEVAQAAADVKTSERAVAALQDALDVQKQRLENAKIFAPQDGLVVYANVSPFSSMEGGMERRRDEGRSRGGRGDGGGGGGRRGRGEGRGGDSAAGGQSGQGGGGASGATSASRGSAGAGSGNAGGGGAAGTSGGSGSSGTGSGNSGGGTSGAGGGGGSGGGNDGAARAGASFVSYPSMRPSSSMASARTNGSAGSAAGNSTSAANGTGAAAGASPMAMAPQPGGRTGFQGSFGGQGYEFYGTPGFLEEGLMVRQRQELIRLPDVSRMIAEIKIHESRVRQIRPGLTAFVRIDSIPERRFRATVRRVAPLPDSQMSWMNPDLKVYPTDLLIEDPLPDLKPGVSARAEVVITNLTGVLSVPIQAVARLSGENVCFIQKGSGIAPVPVSIGWSNDRFQEITDGLQEGDRVLLAPPIDEGLDEGSAAPEVPSAADTAAPPPPAPGPGPENGPANGIDARSGPPPGEPRLRRRDAAVNEGEAPAERREGRGRERRRRDAPEPAE